jgi:hypothetical protein
MANYFNAIELNDEQLDMVAGGDGNGSIIVNSIHSDTSATNVFASNNTSYGAAFSIRNNVGQNTQIDNSTHNWLNFGS